MNLNLKGKVVVVSGGGNGIGRGIVQSFANEGAIPIILGRSENVISELRNRSQKGEFFKVEMTNEDALKKCVEEILDKYGQIDVVVNNAGVNDAVSLKQGPSEFVESLYKNLVHYYALVHYAAPSLIKCKGNIINIGSKAGITGQGGTSGYSAAKGAIVGLTREWAIDFEKHGVRCNCIIPAECMTPLYKGWIDKTEHPEITLKNINETVPLGNRMTSIEELADTVVFVSSDKSSHTTGQILFVDGGYVHLDRAYTMETPHLETSFASNP